MRDAVVRMRVVGRMIGAQLRQHRIALIGRQARELLADLDDARRGRAGAALRERQLAPLAQTISNR